MPLRNILYQPFDDSYVVGSVDLKYNEREGWLWALKIKDSYRGLGHGNKFMLAIIKECRSLGLPSIKLSCYTNNDVALNMYAKHGFVIYKTYDDQWEQGVHELELKLNQDETITQVDDTNTDTIGVNVH